MKKLVFIAILAVTSMISCVWAKTAEYSLAICAMFQNEAPFLKQ